MKTETEDSSQPPPPVEELEEPQETYTDRLKRVVLGEPRDITDHSLFHRLSLIPFLAWVGLGADGLSSSAYGPEAAFRTLGEHTYLAVALAVLTAVTVVVLSTAYSLLIEQFPYGGGGYVVATKLLGERAGLVSGCALLVDYVLTITVSIAAAGDALFSFLPIEWHSWKLLAEILIIVALTVLNIRGVRESVLVLTPVFILFLLTHVALISGTIGAHAPEIPRLAGSLGDGFHGGLQSLGIAGMFLLFIHAYSLGGGTYTGIEAVSNGLMIMREPRVKTAKRTMVYMAASLAFTAAGLLLAYLLIGVTHVEGKTMNAVLFERLLHGFPLGHAMVIVTLISEGAILAVAAQGGFLAGPRVLANMAIDSWVPHRFGALSERLTTANGIVLMGATSLIALLYTRGDVTHLVIMYSINVFITFSLAMFGMFRSWLRSRKAREHWKRRTALFGVAFLFCITILGITVVEKFAEGGWLTLVVTGGFVALCVLIRRHYRTVAAYLGKLDTALGDIPSSGSPSTEDPDPTKPIASVLVGSYGGLGIHTVLNIFRSFPGHFKGLVFVSVGVIDSGEFKGEKEIEALKARTEQALRKYVELARRLGIPATSRYSIGTEAVAEAEELCLQVAKEFPQTTFFAGKVIFQKERWYQRLLHNETAFAIQKRLQWGGQTMVIMPVRVW
ncbi:MAG: APC family permease [Acidobacteria bacterium]|nr:APC family permease [Acidobacteriota bacterium]